MALLSSLKSVVILTLEQQVSTLIYALGKEADKVFKTFTFNNAADANKYELVLQKFNDHFVPRTNILHERAKFYNRHHKVGESVEQFHRSLHDLASTCSFENLEEAVRDRLVIGLLDKEVAQKLQLEDLSKVNLKYAVDTANGWPEYKEDCQLGARHLYQARSELSISDGLLLKGDRIIIPATLQKEVLGHIHQGHFGITKCRERAASSVWWPGISKDISDLIGKCRVCQEKQSSQTREPLLSSPLPQRPFQQMAADLCEHNGRHYLVVVDYYSRYLDICFLSKTTSLVVIGHLKKIFARHGVPETLVSGNGPQFSLSEFKAFSDFWNFQHVTTSRHFPQANGAAERAVRTAKHILNQDDVFLALLVYRASPIVELKVSPAELAYGRKLWTTLPAPPKSLVPNPSYPRTKMILDYIADGPQDRASDNFKCCHT